jgi:hypothetical protein
MGLGLYIFRFKFRALHSLLLCALLPGYIAAAAAHSHESRPNINPDTTCNFLGCECARGAAAAEPDLG